MRLQDLCGLLKYTLRNNFTETLALARKLFAPEHYALLHKEVPKTSF